MRRSALRVALTSVLLASMASAGCGFHEGPPAPILLFNGAGAAASDVAAIEALLEREHLAYDTATSPELDAMSASQLLTHRLLIVPGGNFVAMGDGLDERTTAVVHEAVDGGLSYLGICAGAFLAGHFDPPYRAFDLTSGVQFHFYSAEDRGIRRAAVRIARPGAPALEQYWEDGPHLSGWGDVVGTFPDGTPAIVQGNVGRGWVVLSGVHPEAPASWREGLTLGTDASVNADYAVTLIRAALERQRLPTF